MVAQIIGYVNSNVEVIRTASQVRRSNRGDLLVTLGLRIGDFGRGGAQDFAFVGFLDEGDYADVFGVGVGL